MAVLSVLCLYCAQDCQAQSEEVRVGDKLYVKDAAAIVTSSPGGRRRGELYLNTPVKVTEKRGQWAKVSASLWVKQSSLGEKSKAGKRKVSLKKDQPLQVLTYQTKKSYRRVLLALVCT